MGLEIIRVQADGIFEFRAGLGKLALLPEKQSEVIMGSIGGRLDFKRPSKVAGGIGRLSTNELEAAEFGVSLGVTGLDAQQKLVVSDAVADEPVAAIPRKNREIIGVAGNDLE